MNTHTSPLAQIMALETQARRSYEAGDYTQANEALDKADALRRAWEAKRNGNRDRLIAKMVEAQQLARIALESRARP
jgi:triphosphoribosyl-dephospho-CoA synthetase